MPFKTPLGGHELPHDKDVLTPEEQELMRKLAQKVVDWQMTVPAILFLESTKPLSYIGTQVMVFFEPFVSAIFDVKDYNLFRQMMENRDNVERLLQKIEELDAIQQEKEREQKRLLKADRKAGHKRSIWRWLFGR
ncbi:MAG: hypothetical protein A2W25_08370 [candidate division Zixibacteria bacterium RBG_16_53_22]|nr:MAG: hypothetical protein A2W25_08370 [candidate division Zixibacteria bacterium RBG_16_53_22]